MNSTELSRDWTETEQIPDAQKLPEVYYETGRKDYWILNSRKEWITINETSLKRLLRKDGLSAYRPEGEPLSPLESHLVEIQRNFDVAYAGPMAGYSKGPLEICGQRILVTNSPRIITPKPGDYPLMQQFVTNLFCEKQLP